MKILTIVHVSFVCLYVCMFVCFGLYRVSSVTRRRTNGVRNDGVCEVPGRNYSLILNCYTSKTVNTILEV